MRTCFKWMQPVNVYLFYSLSSFHSFIYRNLKYLNFLYFGVYNSGLHWTFYPVLKFWHHLNIISMIILDNTYLTATDQCPMLPGILRLLLDLKMEELAQSKKLLDGHWRETVYKYPVPQKQVRVFLYQYPVPENQFSGIRNYLLVLFSTRPG